jgi:hypothetical protein
MSSTTYDDEIKIQHGIKGRPESPALERTARLAIEAAFSEVVSSKSLYQKVTVDLSQLPAALKAAKVAPGSIRVSLLEDEVAIRPWELETHHQGDQAAHFPIFAAASAGGQPVGTPLHEMQIHFYAPGVQLQCATCKGERTFIALVASRQFNLENPYPRTSSQGGTEQVYTLYYRCEGCRKFTYSVLVRRDRLRLHLCGFAPRRLQKSVRSVPKPLEPILNDGSDAVSEGDLYGGFYHLRTLIEHFAKLRLGLPADAQERGEDLLAKYYKTIPPALSSTLPSMTTSYEVLSKHLHARSGTIEIFNEQVAAVCDHIEGVGILSKYVSAKQGATANP